LPTTYERGLITKAAVLGRGTMEIGQTIEDRVIAEMEFRENRFFLFAHEPVNHVICSWPERMVGFVVRAVPVPDAPTDPQETPA